ncbi:guanine nucleotide-binding protein subunit gamma-1-like [Amblyomma americanum]
MLVILKIIKLNAFLSALWNALCILFPVRHLYRRGSATSPRQCLGIFRYFEMSNLQQQRKIVEQLRREAGLKRMEVSAAVEDLKKYIQEHESDDYLLVGFHSQKSNPFREKSSCSLL